MALYFSFEHKIKNGKIALGMAVTVYGGKSMVENRNIQPHPYIN
jgi:hypothetical protein